MSKADEILADIKKNPDKHRHDYSGLMRCCMVDGAMDLSLVEAHEGLVEGEFRTSRCDVTKGPCACGAWH